MLSQAELDTIASRLSTIFGSSHKTPPFNALSNGAISKLNFLVSGRVSSWCRHFQYLGFLTGAPTTNFARKRVKPRYLTLFRATKKCVVIRRAGLLYEMGYPFRSTVIVPMQFLNIFRPKLRPLPFYNSWKSEDRVSKSKIEFLALASI